MDRALNGPLDLVVAMDRLTVRLADPQNPLCVIVAEVT